MKNILLIAFIFGSFVASAQSTAPRFGTTASRDNTFRTLSLAKTTLTEVAGNDTISMTPKNFQTYYNVTVLDSATFQIASTAYSYYGDKIDLVVTCTTGDLVKFIGSNLLTAGTATASSNGRVIVGFVFDGAKWVETSRVAQ
jgi:hypothetical protein